MGKKQTPVWQMLGIAEPPVVRGMWEYGVVWTPEDPRPTWWENVRSDIRWGLWSLHYWGKKVRRDIEHGRQHDPRTTLALRAANRLVLAVVAATAWLYRVTQEGEVRAGR